MALEQEKKDILAKILESPDFKDSKRYAELLQFLVQKSFIGEILKESTIAHEFFGRDRSFDPGKDSFVRSYISGLRKKIEHYYLTTPEQFKTKICIPKGQYNVHFVESDLCPPKTNQFVFKKSYLIYPLVTLALILFTAAIVGLLFFLQDSKNEIKDDPFLSSFIGTPANKTIIALGDYFFFTDNQIFPKNRTYFRLSDINNEKDFLEWLEKNPGQKGKLEPLNFTYHRTSASLGLLKVLQRFKDTDNFEVKMASELKWQDFEKKDIIFIGSLKTLYILDTLLEKTNFRCNLAKNEISIIPGNGEEKKYTRADPVRAGRYSEDYGIILKISNSNLNSIMVLTGFSEVGITAAVKIAMDEKFLDSLKSHFNVTLYDSHKYFSVISKAEGVHQTLFSYKLEGFHFF